MSRRKKIARHFPVIETEEWKEAELQMKGSLRFRTEPAEQERGDTEAQQRELIDLRSEGLASSPVMSEPASVISDECLRHSVEVRPQTFELHTPMEPEPIRFSTPNLGNVTISMPNPRTERFPAYEPQTMPRNIMCGEPVLQQIHGEIVIEPIEEAKRRQQAIRDEMDSLLKSTLEEKQRLEEMREAAKEREEQYKQYEEDMIRERQELQEKFEEQQRQQREEEGKQKEYEKKRCKEMADEVNNKWQRIRRRITLKENPEWEEVERLSLNGEFSDDEEDQHRSRYDLRPKRHFPLLYKGYKRTYVPWSFADLKGLVEQLPSINDGGQKWITAFEERTAGQRLAIGDIKAILSQTIGVGKVKMEAILGLAHMATFATTQDDDDKSFDPYRNSVWDAIRKEYPSVMDPSQLETMELKPGACVNDFISSFQKKVAGRNRFILEPDGNQSKTFPNDA